MTVIFIKDFTPTFLSIYLSVAKCSKKLEGHLAADHDKEMYCKPCYGRNFGPKGYGYAGGAGTGLSNEAQHPDETDK